jgi:hypothetical protein
LACACEHVTGDGGDGEWRLLQIFAAELRRDGDLLQLVGLLFLRQRDAGGHQQGQ